MISWLLRELERNPTTVFHKADLLKKSKSQFEKLKRQGFLTYCQPSAHHETYPCSLPCSKTCSMEVVRMGGELFAICPKDTEVDPIFLTEDDISRYRFCLDTLIKAIREANDFVGDNYPFSRHLCFIGERVIQGMNTAFVFALFPNIKSAEPHLLSLPARIPQNCQRIMVVTPSLSLTQDLIYSKLTTVSIIPLTLRASFGQYDFKMGYLDALKKRHPTGGSSHVPGLASEQRADCDQYIFKKVGDEGDMWIIRYGHQGISVKDAKGIKYIHYLVKNRGKPKSCRDIEEGYQKEFTHSVRQTNESTFNEDSIHVGEMDLTSFDKWDDLDPKILYAQRGKWASEKDKETDPSLIADLTDNIEKMDAYLSSITDKDGNPRHQGQIEKSRKRVSMAINTAKKNIKDKNEQIGTHFEVTIKADGISFVYKPDRHIGWALS